MYAIGQSFTRLQPVNDFSDSALALASAMAGRPAHHCVLDLPPTRLLPVHTSALINAWHDALHRCLAQPTQLEQRKGHRRVQVLGSAIFDFDPSGHLDVYHWGFDENDLSALFRFDAGAVGIQDVPYQDLWMNVFKDGALRALQRRFPGQGALVNDYIDWAHRDLVRRLLQASNQVTVRQRIATDLGLDPAILEVAGRIQRSTRPRYPLRADAYNLVLAHRQDYLTLLEEAPQLIPLFALLADAVSDSGDNPGEVTERMRRYVVRFAGLRPALWRLLCREGTAWMQAFLAYYDCDSDSLDYIALDLLRMAQAFGTHALVAPWLLHAVLQLGGNPNRPKAGYCHNLDDLFGLCARLGLLASRADEASLAYLQENAIAIFGWADQHLRTLPEDFVRRVRLPGLMARVRAQQEQDRLALMHQQSWDVPYRLVLERADVHAVILDSALAVWQEGFDMRHCAANYIERCAKGEDLMVSLRPADGGSGLATVAFDMSGPRVRVRLISGFANALVTPEIHHLAQTCARQLQKQRQAIRDALAGNAADQREAA